MTKSIKLNAANTLSIKKKIDTDITKFSHIIRDENVMSKKAKAAGQTTFNYEDFKKTNYYAIFSACEAKEDITLLKMIKTLNPQLKAQKGKKNIGSTETFSKEKIAQLIHDQQLEANKFDAMLEKFNTEATIEISEDKSDDFKEYITA